MPDPLDRLPPQVLDAMRRGSLLEALKLLRQSGIGLKDARALLEAQRSRADSPAAPSRTAQPATRFESHQPTPGAVLGDLSPGQVSNAGNTAWWWILLALIGLVFYFLLR